MNPNEIRINGLLLTILGTEEDGSQMISSHVWLPKSAEATWHTGFRAPVVLDYVETVWTTYGQKYLYRLRK